MEDEILRLKRLTLESEDSSYDSDYETTDGASHNDVSRTVSDTLGQEFDEYITSTRFSRVSSINGQETALSFSTDFIQPSTQSDDPQYQSRVDFARKLGYSEEQFKVALSKLGPCPSQDELLAELIQLDCWNSASLPRGDAASNSDAGSSGSGGVATATNIGAKSIILRHIVIDGSNVAMSHGSNKVFSCRGIRLAVDYFRQRGHKDVTVFVPSYRKENGRPDDPIADQEILLDLEKEGILVFTPSRTIGNKRFVCYDDRYILKLAVEADGIVVSNDNYRDLTIESPEFKKVITERMLMYSFVNDRFMPPEDPLGRNGPTLDQFLSKTPLKSAPPCPYGRKCTYGVKCKYFHPIIKQSVSDSLRKQAALKATQSLPLSSNKQTPISRTRSAVPLGNGTLSLPPQQTTPNTHKKLQRQLSINPVCDPRVNLGCGPASDGSFRGPSTYLSPFPTQPGLAEVWSPPSHSPPPEDEERKRIFYHLAAIFPKYQVTQVMSMFPQEKDPQVICKHIIRQFN